MQRKPSNEQTLHINGALASQRLTQVGTTVVVPIADVAKALGLQVAKTKTGYALIKAGGANAVDGLRGKIGETLFDGKWRFTVQGMREEPRYTLETKAATDYGVISPVAVIQGSTYEPKPGYRLVVFRCQAKNGQRTPQQLWWAQQDVRTALATDSGESFPPILTDIASEAFQSKAILPGAKLEYNLVFCLPVGARPSELVITLRTVADRGSDLRIAL